MHWYRTMNGRLRFSVHTNYGSLPSERARVRLVRYVVPPEDEGTRETKPTKRIGKVAVFFLSSPPLASSELVTRYLSRAARNQTKND